MKKNRMMRVASTLLVAVLLTTSVISGTFAKYVTSDSANDSARVAKFGVVVTGKKGDDNQMFSKEYASNDDEYTAVTVASSTNVVAPGTNGTMSSFEVTGTPEVAVRVTYDDVDVELGNNWIDKDDTTKFYCPIKVTINTDTLCGLDYESADAFESAIQEKIIAAKEDYAPGTDLSAVNDDLNISWVWDFISDGETYAYGTQNDAKDTFLGDRAAADEANAGTISITATCTVTQID